MLTTYTNYHIASPDTCILNTIKENALHMLDNYYINELHLPNPKLMFYNAFGFRLHIPFILPTIECGDIIAYTHGIYCGKDLYQLFMYILENNADSLHLAIIMDDDNEKIHNLTTTGTISFVEAYNNIKQEITLLNTTKPKNYVERIHKIIRNYMQLNGIEYISQRFWELLIKTEMHAFTYSGVLVI